MFYGLNFARKYLSPSIDLGKFENLRTVRKLPKTAVVESVNVPNLKTVQNILSKNVKNSRVHIKEKYNVKPYL